MACDPGLEGLLPGLLRCFAGLRGRVRGVPGGVRGSAEPVADVGGLLCSHLMREFRVLLAAGSATVREGAASACAGRRRHCGTDTRVYRRRGALDASICCLTRRRIVVTRARRVAGAAREEEPDEDNPGDAACLCAGIVPAPGRVTVTGGSTGQVSGHAVLVAGVALLRPEEQVLEAMLAGWAGQQAARGLGGETISGRSGFIRLPKRLPSNCRCDVSALAEHGRLCTPVHKRVHRQRPLFGTIALHT